MTVGETKNDILVKFLYYDTDTDYDRCSNEVNGGVYGLF